MGLAFEKPNHAKAKRERAKDALKAWQDARRTVLARDGRRCRCCGSTYQVDVHHRQFRSVGGGKTDPRNLLALCRVCHSDIHAYRLTIVGDNANARLRFKRRNG